jgi:serine/threonine protein kinase
MTDESTSCPTPDQLKSLIDGTLPESDQATAQSHVDSCAACQRTLESLVAGSASWDSALGHLRHEPVRIQETAFSEAIEQMKAEEFIESSDAAQTNGNALSFLTPSDQPGSIGRLGAYEVTEVIGQGGMGIVVKAFDPALHRVVAVKVLAPYLAHNSQARKRFVREAQAIAAVSHDHVITIHAIDESPEQPKIVMQYIAGRSLQQRIDAEGSLDLKEILRIGMQTASGLAAAHAQGLVHRDVKPSNILLENGIQRVKLTDFGLARAVDDASLTQSGAIAGTPQYMAPEQANGDAVDYRADLFSLGSVMYAMCVGHSPFRASTTMGVLKRVCHDPARPIQELNADIPDWLCAIIMKLLAKKPEERFQSAKAVAELLEKWLAHVQQPMAVAKPPVIASPSPGSMSNSMPQSNKAFDSVSSDAKDRSRRELDSRTIFFQPVSFQWLLFFFLAGTAGTMAFVLSRQPFRPDFGNIGELFLVSLPGGIVASFFGMLFVAVARLVWANLYSYVPWVSKTFEASGDSRTNDQMNRGLWGGLRPESLAMLAAILMMGLTFSPLEAAVVAIIVWRIATWKAAAPVPDQRSSFAVPTDDVSGFQPPTQQASWISSVGHETKELPKRVFSSVRNAFVSSSPEKKRILLAIGWFLAGGLDLLFAMKLLFERDPYEIMRPGRVPVGLFALAIGLISFAVSNSIRASQNFGFVQTMSYIGMLPLSLGALIRIPLGITTLFWQHSPETKTVFEATPYQDTNLGRLLTLIGKFSQRSLKTLAWLLAWTTLWSLLFWAVFLLWAAPYGPSEYVIYDKSTVTLKDAPGKRFELIWSGTGDSYGLSPAVQSVRPQQLGLGQVGGIRESQLLITIPDQPVTEQQAEEFTREIARGLTLLLGESFPEHAASLSKSVLDLQSRQRETKAPISDITSYQRPFIQRFGNFDRPISTPWKGFVRLGSALDSEMFKADLDTNVSYFDCKPSMTLIAIGLTYALLFWAVSFWILKNGYFPRVKMKPVEVAMAT